MELVSFGVRLVKTHIKNVGEEPPQAELNFSMKWVGIIFKTSRNAKGKAGKKKQEKAKKGKRIKNWKPRSATVSGETKSRTIGQGNEKKEQCMSAICMDMQSANVKKSKLGKAESPNFFDVKEPLSDSFTQCIISTC